MWIYKKQFKKPEPKKKTVAAKKPRATKPKADAQKTGQGRTGPRRSDTSEAVVQNPEKPKAASAKSGGKRKDAK